MVQTITIKIPDSGRRIFEAIKDVIRGFGNIVKDPKTALAEIGKGAVQYVQIFIYFNNYVPEKYKINVDSMIISTHVLDTRV